MSNDSAPIEVDEETYVAYQNEPEEDENEPTVISKGLRMGDLVENEIVGDTDIQNGLHAEIHSTGPNKSDEAGNEQLDEVEEDIDEDYGQEEFADVGTSSVQCVGNYSNTDANSEVIDQGIEEEVGGQL